LKAIQPLPALRILLAEDDALIGAFLAELLETMGYDICAITATETDTVAAAILHRPDVMIIDAHLRNGSGIAAVEAILQHGFIPHVFASGDSSTILANMPAAIILHKPFRQSELVLAINDALAAHAIS
jgi:DNA-binding response OmpR family regulator